MIRLKKKISILTFLLLFIYLMVFAGSAVCAERLAVAVDIANMRSGPGTENPLLWQVERYHPFIVLERKGKWVKVRDFENWEAWIAANLLSDIPSVITIKGKCNVRSLPSTKGRILFTVDRGVPFRVLEKKKDWIRVKHADNDVGWIYKTLVW